MFEQATSLGAEYIGATVNGISVHDGFFTVTTDNESLHAKTVIIASGTAQKRLGVPGEDRYAGRGVSWCAICDGSLYKDEDVAVVGGGNSALDETIYLANLASKVYLIHRRDQFRAERSLVDRVRELKNVELVLNARVVEFFGADTLQGVTVENLETKEQRQLRSGHVSNTSGRFPRPTSSGILGSWRRTVISRWTRIARRQSKACLPAAMSSTKTSGRSRPRSATGRSPR